MTASPDSVDRILFDVVSATGAHDVRVAVLDDASGALTTLLAPMAAAGAGAGAGAGALSVYCDSLDAETHVRQEASASGTSPSWHTDLSTALAGATMVALRLPKSLAALDEIAESVARYAAPDVRLYAGGRVKHMTRGMNDVLGRHFESVSASLGQQKSRVLVAAGPRPGQESSYPRRGYDADLDLTVCAHGSTFAGPSVDLGTRFLASFLDKIPATATEVADLGCGTGVLATLVARRLSSARVRATDDSLAACDSTAATATANGVAEQVGVARMDLLSAVPDASLDVIVCNPPFHRGTSRDSDVAFAMFGEAARTLRPSGELWTVYNSHLPYLPTLRRRVGSTVVMGQNTGYFVTRSTVSRPRAARV